MNNKKYRAILFTVIVFIILVISTIAASWTKLMDFIYDVATSCGCTTVEYDKRPILPGQSLNMSINFRPLSKEYFFKKNLYKM